MSAAVLAAAVAVAVPGKLTPVSEIAVPGGGEIHRLEQSVGGVPVAGGELVVADPANGPAVVVADETLTGSRLDRGARARPALDRATAIARAQRVARVRRLRAPPRARLVVARTGDLAWELRLASARPLADLLVTVDTSNGEVLGLRDVLWRATGSALLFTPNPVVTQGGFAGLRDRRDRSSPQLDSLRAPVDLPRLESARGCLRGQYVEARLGKRAKRVCDPSLAWTANRSANVFEALMAYHHVDRTRAYLETLGLSRGLSPKPQRVRANGISADNSYYSSFTRGITLGTGGVDDGEDADVIIHEYGHAVQHQQVKHFGQRFQGAAMGEGFGDYLAAVLSSQMTGGDAEFDPCMFEWDAVSYAPGPCARRTDLPLTVPRVRRRCPGDPHCQGQAWSSTLWELRGALGADPEDRAIVDRVLLESHLMLTRRANFRDGARALLAADDLLYAGTHRPTIEAELIERGFCRERGC
ncbi:MAG: M36 family metallopeptidase [Solirubrobacterales bacterium]